MHADTTPSNSMDGNVIPSDGQMAYTIPHAAKVLDMGNRTVWALVHSGALKSFTIGRSRRIARADLVAYIEHLRAGGSAA